MEQIAAGIAAVLRTTLANETEVKAGSGALA
jgi:hypothetical protein